MPFRPATATSTLPAPTVTSNRAPTPFAPLPTQFAPQKSSSPPKSLPERWATTRPKYVESLSLLFLAQTHSISFLTRLQKSISSTFSQTSLPFIDLYLIHAPYGGRAARLGTWDALVSAQKAGQIRSLGVSNYGIHHLAELESHIRSLDSQHGPGAGGTISVGQWELHPWLPRDDIVSWCRARNIVIEAYCPLVRGQRAEDPILKEIAAKHGKTWAQVLLRWSLQKGFVPLPKSVTPSRIEENADIYDFELSGQDMERLERKGAYEPCSWDPTVSGD
jgi:diketogulonate reductase-like aldo/keto reductase